MYSNNCRFCFFTRFHNEYLFEKGKQIRNAGYPCRSNDHPWLEIRWSFSPAGRIPLVWGALTHLVLPTSTWLFSGGVSSASLRCIIYVGLQLSPRRRRSYIVCCVSHSAGSIGCVGERSDYYYIIVVVRIRENIRVQNVSQCENSEGTCLGLKLPEI